MSVRGTWVMLLVTCLSCVGERARPHALYPSGTNVRDGELAVLEGHVGEVDGVSVGHLGSLFVLLPGCHVVRSRGNWGQSGSTWAVGASIPPISFAIPMQAGHHYSVRVLERIWQGHGYVQLKVFESDLSGKHVREIPPARDATELNRCMRIPPNTSTRLNTSEYLRIPQPG